MFPRVKHRAARRLLQFSKLTILDIAEDCAIPGDEHEACRQSELNSTMESDQDDGRSTSGASPETPGSVSPPTFPDEPGNENRDSGPGSNGGAGGIGN